MHFILLMKFALFCSYLELAVQASVRIRVQIPITHINASECGVLPAILEHGRWRQEILEQAGWID